MATRSITDIKPNLDSEGALLSVSFIVNVTDGQIKESTPWQTPMPKPAPAEGEPAHSATTLKPTCTTLADNAGIFADLERKVAERKARAAPVPGFVPPAPQTDAEKRDTWFNQVDNHIGDIQTRYTRFERGYIEREAAAKAYTDSNYTIDPTTWITRFADNVGMEYPAAAALILAQAAKLRPAVQALENLRMDKYLILRAATPAAAEAEFVRIINDANTIAASLK